jgi:hypothetical protein
MSFLKIACFIHQTTQDEQFTGMWWVWLMYGGQWPATAKSKIRPQSEKFQSFKKV